MRTKIMIILSVPILIILNYDIYDKEQIKKHGQTLLLELAPVDPRSLMQGDYMRLRYAIESHAPAAELADHKKRGYLVIQADEHRVAQFVRFYEKEPLAADEQLLHFHKKNDQINVVPHSFFFQEGHAKHYENAQYGVFKFSRSGKHLLIGLADEHKKLLSAL